MYQNKQFKNQQTKITDNCQNWNEEPRFSVLPQTIELNN